MTKKEEFNIGRQIIDTFCSINNIMKPLTVISDKINHLGYYAFDTPDTVFINLKKCNRTTRRNHPGMVYESTIIGTMLHEFGHYIHFTHYTELTKRWKHVKNEPFIHYYENDIIEDIAENIRMFIAYPESIQQGRPKHNKILKKIFNTDMCYIPDHIRQLYDITYEKVDMSKWQRFLV